MLNLLKVLIGLTMTRYELTGDTRWARLAVRLIDLAEEYELEEAGPCN